MPELIRSVFSRLQTYVQDRRHPPRLRVRLLFTVSLCRKCYGKGLRPEPALKGYTRDLSAGGLALNLPQVHLDGHYLAADDSEVKLRLELPTGPISMLVIPRRYEGLEQAELGYRYLIGVQITEISDEDRKRYLSFIAPEDVRSLPALQTEIAPEMEVSYAPTEQEPTREGTSWPTWWRGPAWKPIYQITEISVEDRTSYPGSEVRRAAEAEGLKGLRESALKKVFSGISTLHEINRVTFVEEVNVSK